MKGEQPRLQAPSFPGMPCPHPFLTSLLKCRTYSAFLFLGPTMEKL